MSFVNTVCLLEVILHRFSLYIFRTYKFSDKHRFLLNTGSILDSSFYLVIAWHVIGSNGHIANA